MEYSNLSICTITLDKHLQTCGYWYLVQNDCMSHTAFATEKGFKNWLSERGLYINQELPQKGTHSYQKIIGSYKTKSHMNYKDFNDLYDTSIVKTKTLSNGDYVIAFITEDDNGIRTVHTLNPNMIERYVFDYFESEAEMK